MNPESPPMSWKVLVSGYVPKYLYELGRIDTAGPFPDLEKLSHVNERAHAADQDASFSQRLRQGLPKPAPRCSAANGKASLAPPLVLGARHDCAHWHRRAGITPARD